MKKTLHHIEPSPPRSAIESKIIFRISWRQILCLLMISCARSRLPGRIPFLLIMLYEYDLLDRESILPKYCNCTSIQKL